MSCRAAENKLTKAVKGSSSANYYRDPLGRICRSVINSYDAAGRLTALRLYHRGATIEDITEKGRFDYGYNAVNNREWVKRETGKGDVYAYDATQQLRAVWYDASNVDTTATSPARTASSIDRSLGNSKIRCSYRMGKL